MKHRARRTMSLTFEERAGFKPSGFPLKAQEVISHVPRERNATKGLQVEFGVYLGGMSGMITTRNHLAK